MSLRLSGLSLLALPIVSLASTQTLSLEEIVVTAQHRQQLLLEVPVAITVLDGEQLKQQGINDIEGMVRLTPGLSGWEQGASTPIYAIRGISSNSFGIGGEASVAVIVDDAYVGRINSTSATLLDLERVEVLKGPQGTLFGRNASAGAILVHQNKPVDTSSAEIQLAAGDNQRRDAALTVNLPLSDRWFVRANGFYFNDDGDATNIIYNKPVGDEMTTGGKLALRYLHQALDITLSYADQTTKTGGLGYETLSPELAAAGGVTANPFNDKLATDIDTYDKVSNRDALLRLGWAINDQLSLLSITAYHENESPNLFDVDGSAVFLTSAGFIERDSETLSQEFRFNGSHQNFDWVAGAIAFQEQVSTTIELGYSDINVLSGLPVSPGAPFPDFALCDAVSDFIFGPCQSSVTELAYHRGDYQSYGAFADGSWAINNRLTLSAGLRYSRDHKEFAYRADPVNSVTTQLNASPANPSGNLLGYSSTEWQPLHEDWDNWQPRLAATFALSEQQSLFANWSQGYKAGGFEPASSPELSVYKPETVNSMDIGIRGTGWGNVAHYQLSLYAYDYQDYQVQVIDNGIARTINSNGVDGRGLETELAFQLSSHWRAEFNYTYTDSEFKSQVTDTGNLKGKRTILTPQHNTVLSLNYRSTNYTWGSLGLLWQTHYQSDQYFTIENTDDARQGNFSLSDISASYYSTQEDWQVDVSMHNVFDQDHLIFQQDVGAGLVARRGKPRLLSARFSMSL